jgi:exopolysaccharide production protein ExoZ
LSVENKINLNRNYFYGLDAIRFLAAAMVAIFHLTWRTDDTQLFAIYGWVGVQIFFVISGFVIANSAQGRSPASFIKSRFLRLYPAAMICSSITFLVIVQHNGWIGSNFEAFIRSFFLFVEGPFLASAYWTLPVELAFYTLILVVLSVGNSIKMVTVARALVLYSMTYTLIYFCLSQLSIDVPLLDMGYGIKNLSLLRHGLFFSIGIFLWQIINNPFKKIDSALLFFALVLSWMEIGDRSQEILGKIGDVSSSFFQVSWVPVVVFYTACLLIFLLSRTKISLPDKLERLLRIAGLATYPFYLLHENIGNRVKWYVVKNTDFSKLEAAFCGFSVALICAIVVAVKLEPWLAHWFIRIIDRLNNKKMRSETIV